MDVHVLHLMVEERRGTPVVLYNEGIEAATCTFIAVLVRGFKLCANSALQAVPAKQGAVIEREDLITNF